MKPDTAVLPRLYAIVDAECAALHGCDAADLADEYLRASVRLMQVRAKKLGGADFLALCDTAVGLAANVGGLVIVNDRADMAKMAGAAGVHVGQDDLPVRDVRDLMGPDAIVGLSTHTREQLDAAANEPAASYLAVGPVFATSTKDATWHEPVGLELVRYAVSVAGGRPVVAIGGITLDRARSVIEAGAAAVAVISDLLVTGDPAARVRGFLERLAG